MTQRIDIDFSAGVKLIHVIVAIVLLLLFFGARMAIIPQYLVYKQEMRGRAAFAEAEQNRLILVEEAKARLEAEKLNAQSEIERAKGMAQAMEIENGQLTAEYNQYLFIRTLEDMAKQGDLPQIIYVPANGLLPVMDLKTN